MRGTGAFAVGNIRGAVDWSCTIDCCGDGRERRDRAVERAHQSSPYPVELTHVLAAAMAMETIH